MKMITLKGLQGHKGNGEGMLYSGFIAGGVMRPSPAFSTRESFFQMLRPLRRTSDFGSENSQERGGAVGGTPLK